MRKQSRTMRCDAQRGGARGREGFDSHQAALIARIFSAVSKCFPSSLQYLHLHS